MSVLARILKNPVLPTYIRLLIRFLMHMSMVEWSCTWLWSVF